jgi:hypothetical protein
MRCPPPVGGRSHRDCRPPIASLAAPDGVLDVAAAAGRIGRSVRAPARAADEHWLSPPSPTRGRSVSWQAGTAADDACTSRRQSPHRQRHGHPSSRSGSTSRTDQLRGPGPGGRTGHVQAAHTAERRRSGRAALPVPRILPLRVLEPLFARSHSGVAAVVQVRLSHEVPRHGDEISIVGGYQKDGDQCSKLPFLLPAELHGASSFH